MKHLVIAARIITILACFFSFDGVGPAFVSAAPSAAIALTGGMYTQDFNTLASSGTSSTLPANWYISEIGANANTTYSAGTGSSTTGDTYSFGSTSASDRALGGLQSSGLIPTFGAQFVNNTGATILSLTINYTGEEWRCGATGRGDQLDFQLSANATNLTNGTWTDYNSLDFITPDTASIGAKDGNAAGFRTAISTTITGLAIANGSTFWIRWTDFNASGSDDGLAVDDFSITSSGPPSLPNLSINDVSLNEGDAGTTSFIFTVQLSAPAPVGGVTFDIATADNSATLADNDYQSTTQVGALIPEGADTYSFTVLANGDTNIEPPESFLVNVSNVSNATLGDGSGTGTILNDDLTRIFSVQGSGSVTGMPGAIVTVEGIVTGDFEGPDPALQGFYLQETSGDGDPSTSDGIFIFNADNNNVTLGDRARVTGTVNEFNGQTQIDTVTSIVITGSGNTVPPTDVTLPFTDETSAERYEGMLVRLPQTLTVADTFLLGRFGQVTLSNGRLSQPTSIASPGASASVIQAANDLNRIILDDASQIQYPDPIPFARGGLSLSASNTLRNGDTVTGVMGVFTYGSGGNLSSPNAYRVRPLQTLGGGAPNFIGVNIRPSIPASVGGTVKVAEINLSNYFNTFGISACTNGLLGSATDCRGASNATEFTRQSDKLASAILGLNADVIGVTELENDGYGSTSAIRTLIDKLNTLAGPGVYAFLNVDTAAGLTDALGNDAIKVGLLYKPSAVTPVGTTAVLNSAAFLTGGDGVVRNRVSLLQAFRVNASNEVFLVAVNHFKSKSSPCDAPDAGDGQGECAVVRANAAALLAAWVTTNPTGSGDPDVLLLGDLNAYAHETSITNLTSAGYADMVKHFQGVNAYSYGFDGQWGYLDHSLGSASLLSQSTGLTIFHINADEPSALDYNTEFKSPGQIASLFSADAFRASDHDPILIGLRLDTTPPTVNVPANIIAEATSPSGATVFFSASASDLMDGPRPVTCLPASGSIFPLGVTTVTCSAGDVRGNIGSNSFTVKVQDTTPPSLSLPPGLTVPAVSPLGTPVNFSVSASDLVDASPTVSCAPTSGSVFPVGSTLVTCSAVDDFSNTASGSFTVNVSQQANLLSRSNFTSLMGFPYPWRPQGIPLPYTSSLDFTTFLSPPNSIHLTGSVRNQLQIGYQTVLRPGLIGDRYTFGIFCAADSIPTNAILRVELRFLNNFGRVLGNATVDIPIGTHPFTLTSGAVVAPANYRSINFRFIFQGSNGQAWFDDAFLYSQ